MSALALFKKRWLDLPGNLRGAFWQIISNLCFTVMWVTIKKLGSDMHSLELAFFRCFFGLLITLPFLFAPFLIRGRGSVEVFSVFRTKRRMAIFLRTALGVSGMFCSFYAITRMPLADVTAISFTKTLFTIPLAVLVLNEAVHWRRWSATIIGFIGVLVIVRPGLSDFDPVSLVALLAAFLVAGVIILIKTLSESEGTGTILFYYGIFSTLLLLLPALAVWRWPQEGEWSLLFLLALLGVSGQAANIRSYRIAEATAMAPLGYLRLIFAGFFGFVIFNEIPDFWTWAGAGIIVLSTLYIALRDARAKSRHGASSAQSAV